MAINLILSTFTILALASSLVYASIDNRGLFKSTADAVASDGPSLSPVTPNNIFLLAGQSNMAGRGGDVKLNGTPTWDTIVPPQCNSNPRILRLNQYSNWEEATEPLHQFIDLTKAWGIGPGMPFANSLLARDSNIDVIGLVPCASGRTNISEWSQGTFLYQRLLDRATNATKGITGQIRAMLWYQGENDSNNLNDSSAYKQKLDEFFTNVRSDLHLPLLPVIQVALASGGPYKYKIREAQFNNTLPNVVTVDANGLALEQDNIHLTTASQVQLGQKLADAFLQKFNNI